MEPAWQGFPMAGVRSEPPTSSYPAHHLVPKSLSWRRAGCWERPGEGSTPRLPPLCRPYRGNRGPGRYGVLGGAHKFTQAPGGHLPDPHSRLPGPVSSPDAPAWLRTPELPGMQAPDFLRRATSQATLSTLRPHWLPERSWESKSRPCLSSPAPELKLGPSGCSPHPCGLAGLWGWPQS